jgi:predicted nucleic acid-binding protein
MIHLDTNYVIGLVTTPSSLQTPLLVWLSGGEKIAVSALSWSEFLNGPVSSKQVRDAMTMLEGRIIPFGPSEAEMASRIFNQTSRRRGTEIDCFIAATAICARAPLATQNRKDFLPFVKCGLRLA